MTSARVILWGSDIGAVTWVAERGVGVFQYTPEFARTTFQVAPIRMPLGDVPYEFPELANDAFKGLPGLLADSLPDKFGNAMINAWLATQGRPENSLNPVERLCYIGARGMGALEFMPAMESKKQSGQQVEIAALVDLSNQVLNERQRLAGIMKDGKDASAIGEIIRVGTSAGGARAKAILAWNETTGEFRSGQIEVEKGFSHWIMKFDGINNNRDRELADPQGYGLIEHAYYCMALAAEITMMPCRLYHEGGRSHFMTRRFDRTENGDKLHVQSLAALMHYDYNQPASYSYEQAIQLMLRLNLPMEDIEQQFRRAVFNLIARNQDDHVKNIAFLMDRNGVWRLSPAFDIVYAYNPQGHWTGQHQMSINNRRDEFVMDDLIALASVGNIKKTRAKKITQQVVAAIDEWSHFAKQSGVSSERITEIEKSFVVMH